MAMMDIKRNFLFGLGSVIILLAGVFNTGYFVYKSIDNQQAEKVEIVKIPIHPKIINIQNPYLYTNESIVLSSGEQGELVKVFKIKDDVESSKELMWAKILKKPVPAKIFVGTNNKKKLYMMERQMKVAKTLVMRATAYYPGPEDCAPYADGFTYLDYKAGYGVVAVDPKVIKLRSKVYVEGYGYALAVDIGGAIKGKKIDLCFDTLRESSRYGVKKVVVHILR